MSLISGAYFRGDPKIKPEAWGPAEDVQAAIFENAGRIGIDPALIAIAMPLWERTGSIAYNYGNSNQHGVLSNALFSSAGVSIGSSASRIVVPTAGLSTSKGSLFFTCTPNWSQYDNVIHYLFDSYGGANERFLIYKSNSTANNETLLFSQTIPRGAISYGFAAQRDYSFTVVYGTNKL